MKLLLAAALAATAASPTLAQDPHAGHAGHAAHAAPAAAASTARLNLDTPVSTIMADAKGAAVLEANLPGIGKHEHYEMFKGMGLRQISGAAPAQLPADKLAKIERELAAIK